MDQLKTPAFLLALLCLPIAIAWAIARLRGRPFTPQTPGAIGLALLFTFTGIGHFIMSQPMAEMLPPWVPGRVPMVYATGVLELAVAAMLLMARTRILAAWIVIAMLIAFFPANVYASLQRHPMGGGDWGPMYLLIRAPFQLLLIGWAWGFVIRPEVKKQVNLETSATFKR